jgi:hypothetical protein
MAREKRNRLPAGVEAARKRIDHWRETREKRGPMPEKLWDAAVLAARAHGVWSVARELHVNYESLKGRVAHAEKEKDTGRERSGGFVEVGAAQLVGPSAAPVTVVEVSAADGARLTVRVGGSEQLDVQMLIDSFWRRGG